MENLSMNELLSNTKPVICEECGNDVFVEGTKLRKVSRLLTGDTKDGVLPIPVFVCSKCGHVNKEFMPKGLPEDQEPKTEEKPSSLIL